MKFLAALITAVFVVGCSSDNLKENSVSHNLSSDLLDLGEIDKSKKEVRIYSLTLTNDEESVLTGPAIVSSPFVLLTQNCNSVKINKSCNVKISLDSRPQPLGPISSILSIGSSSVELSVEVINPYSETQPLLSFSSEDLAFGEFYANQSAIKTISFTNISPVVANQNFTLSNSEFSVVSDLCSGKDLLPNRSCSIKVSFSGAGKTSGVKLASLNISNGQSLPLSATVLAQGQSSSQGAVEIAFLEGTEIKEEISLGVVSSSAIKIITIKNVGSIASSELSAQLSNANFSIITNGCLSKVLTPNKSCQVRIQFSGSGKPVATLFESNLQFGSASFPLKAGTTGYVFNNFPVISSLEFAPGEVSGSTYPLSTDNSLSLNFSLNNNVAGNLQVNVGSVCGLNDYGSSQVVGTIGSKNVSVNLQSNVYNSLYVQVTSQAMLSSNCLNISLYQCNVSSGKHFYQGLCEDNSRMCSPGELALIPESTSGTATWDNVSSYQCQISSCNSSFHVEGNACFSNSRTCNSIELASISNSTAGTATWNSSSSSYMCQISACSSSYHVEGNACFDNVRACSSNELALIPESASGVATWNVSTSEYNCQISTCSSSFHVEGNSCFSDERACSAPELSLIPESATGTATWNTSSSTYMCSVETCNSTFHVESNSCLSDTRACTSEELASIPNATTGVATWNPTTESYACVVSECGGTTHEENGMCVDNSRACTAPELAAIPNSATGTATWNPTTETYACVAATCQPSYQLNVSNQCVSSSKIYFQVENASAGRELWVSDGTTGGTSLLLNSTINNAYSNRPAQVFPNSSNSKVGAGVVLNGKMLISINNPSTTGLEYYLSDGTVSGTTLLKDINPGTASGLVIPAGVMMNNKYFFPATNGVNGTELWVTDGTSDGTFMLKDIHTSGNGVNTLAIGSTVVHNNKLYFRGITAAEGDELWVTDGTTNGTMMVKDINPGTPASTITSMISFNGSMFFIAVTAANGAELWTSDGSTAGTVLFREFRSGSTAGVRNSFGMSLIVFGSHFYFTADKGSGDMALYRSDGTFSGTVMFKDLDTGSSSNTDHINFANAAISNGKLYFSYRKLSDSTGIEPWVTDGTDSGTFMLKNIQTIADAASNPSDFIAFNNKVYFIASEAGGAVSVFVSDGTTTGTVKLHAISILSSQGFFVYKDKLYFITTVSGNTAKLYMSDGVSSSVTIVAPTVTPSSLSYPTIY